MRWTKSALAAAALAAGIHPASAQTYTVDSITPMSIGTVSSATSGNTVFLNSADGYVSIISGSGQLIKGPYAYAVIGIRCVDQGLNLCLNPLNTARIVIGRTGVNTGRGLTITTMGVYSGTGTIGSGTNETNSNIDVTLSGWTALNQVRTFRLSLYWPIAGDDSSAATGAASSQFYVYASRSPTTPTSGLLSTVTGYVRRSLKMVKVSDLRFGTFIRPTSGTNTLSVDAAGTRSSATLTLVPSTVSAAQFTVTGEPGDTFSLSYPGSFTMSGPGTALTVTLAPSPAGGTKTMPGSGSLTVATGGSFSVSAGQATGNYTGTFTVTVAYN